MVGWPSARGSRFLAEARHHQIDTDRYARTGTRAERSRARRIVRIRGIAAPGAALVAERGRQDFIGLVPTARIARPAVVFSADSFGEDNGALRAEALD